MELTRAQRLAGELVEMLAPACERIEIAGSIRRQRPDVHDIELVAISTMVLDWTHTPRPLLEEKVIELVELGRVTYGQKNGQRFKQLRYEGEPVDLFIVAPPAQWGVIYAIRTGPAHYSHWLVTPKAQRGALPSHLRVRDGAVWSGDRLIETPEESDFFCNVLGMASVPAPQLRAPGWGN